MKKLFVLLSIAIFGSFSASAQDPHFSQYFASPLHFNPAMTGVFSGNYRFTSIFRNQWQGMMKNNPSDQSGVPAFRTYAGSFDMRLKTGKDMKMDLGFPRLDEQKLLVALPKSGHLGVGVIFLTDVAGAAKMRANTALLSASYIKPLDKKGKQLLSVGLQGGITQRSLDYSNLRFGSQYDNSMGYNQDISSGEDVSGNNYLYGDVSAGLLWYYLRNKRTNFYLGFATHHLNRPEQTFLGDDSAPLPMRFTVNGGAEFKILKSVSLLPTLLYMHQGYFNEINFGANAKLLFRQAEPMGDAIFIGMYYRTVGKTLLKSESLIANLKLHIKNVSIGASYDLVLSDLSNASTNGGCELSLVYIGSLGSRQGVKYGPKW